MVLNKIRGKFLAKPRGKQPYIAANGRNDWIGWISLIEEAIREKAIDNTARVIKEVNAGIMDLVEVEGRMLLNEFNDKVIPKGGGKKYDHVMLIDGNDDRGIDVGILSDYEIESMVSHVDDKDSVGTIFSRDCRIQNKDFKGQDTVGTDKSLQKQGIWLSNIIKQEKKASGTELQIFTESD